jgi:hypothetical protein
MPTISRLAAEVTREEAQMMARSLAAMPPDRQTWRPLNEGRSALEQVQECIAINYWVADMLTSRAVPPLDREQHEKLVAEYADAEKARTGIVASATVVSAAIESFPPEHLDDTLEMPFQPGMVQSFAQILLMAYWNMAYHNGQINYVQTLYGDREMH